MKALRDPTAALLLVTLASATMRFGSNLVLAHLLMPRAFGLVAVTSMVATGLSMLTDTGMWLSIIRKQGPIEKAWLDQLWTLQILRGIALWAGAASLAPLMAHVYQEPELSILLPVSGMVLAIQGTQCLHPLVRMRDFEPALAFKLQLINQLVTAFVSIACALLFANAWALIAGMIAGISAMAILSFAWSSQLPSRPRLTRAFMREQWNLASWLVVSTGLAFFGSQIDRLIFPALFGTAAFGVYSIALSLVFIPQQLGQRWADRVYLPAVAKLSEQASDQNAAKLAGLRRSVSVYVGLASALVCGIGPPFFFALYPNDFSDAAQFVRALGVALYAVLLTYVHRRTVLYFRTHVEAAVEFARLFLFGGTIAVLVALGLTPVPGDYVTIYAGVQLTVYAGLLVAGRQMNVLHFRDDLPGHIAFVAPALLLTGIGDVVAERLGPFAALVAVAIAGGLVCVAAAVRIGLPVLPQQSAPAPARV